MGNLYVMMIQQALPCAFLAMQLGARRVPVLAGPERVDVGEVLDGLRRIRDGQ